MRAFRLPPITKETQRIGFGFRFWVPISCVSRLMTPKVGRARGDEGMRQLQAVRESRGRVERKKGPFGRSIDPPGGPTASELRRAGRRDNFVSDSKGTSPVHQGRLTEAPASRAEEQRAEPISDARVSSGASASGRLTNSAALRNGMHPPCLSLPCLTRAGVCGFESRRPPSGRSASVARSGQALERDRQSAARRVCVLAGIVLLPDGALDHREDKQDVVDRYVGSQ
jgi:hypothetical protein